MKFRKTALIIGLALGILLGGCSEEAPQEGDTGVEVATEIDSGQLLTYGNLLGAEDEAVVNLLGEGQPGYVQGDEESPISGRLYKQGVLGFGGETVVDYTSLTPPTVEAVVITFKGADFDDVVDVVSQQLGEVIMIERTGGNRAEAMWEYNEILFDLTFYGGNLMLTVEKDNRG